MTMTFKVGDVVMLNSGGPKLTVTEIELHDSGRTIVHVTYFAGTEVKNASFPQETLTLFPA
jgi:uncharacterized protein YodC (DUF2158 family)